MSNSDIHLDRFSIPNAVAVEVGEEGLPRLALTAHGSVAHVYAHGAHVTHFQPAGAVPVLFVSKESVFRDGKAIRGGVPVIFPWFGANAEHPTLPSHGFARTRSWKVESTALLGDGRVRADLVLRDDEATRAMWRHPFAARFTVVLGVALEMELHIENTGPEPFHFEEALHTYLRVGDARRIALTGLEQTEYHDKVKGMALATEGSEPIRFTGETDRVYVDTDTTCTIADPELDRRIVIEKFGSSSTVVWNPWIERSAAFADFGDFEWTGMVCVETCNVGRNIVSLAPGATHTMRAVVRVG